MLLKCASSANGDVGAVAVFGGKRCFELLTTSHLPFLILNCNFCGLYYCNSALGRVVIDCQASAVRMPRARSRPFASLLLRIQEIPSFVNDGFSPVLRYVHFQLLPQTTRWKQDDEETKVATYNNPRVSLLGFLLHALPFAAVLALTHHSQCPTGYVGNVSPTTTTTIQFAAKLLEILIQSSLAAISLGLVRSHALGQEALPLGGFLVPYRLTDTSHLWSLDFWGSATSGEFFERKRITIIVAIMASVLIAALVGPAPAIAMNLVGLASHYRSSSFLVLRRVWPFPLRWA